MDDKRIGELIKTMSRRPDKVCREAAEAMAMMQERIAIMQEGRTMIDADRLGMELFLLSAAAGGMTGQAVIDRAMELAGRLSL